MLRLALLCLAPALMIPALALAAGESPTASDRSLRPALLVIDVQNEFMPIMSELDAKQAPYMINGAIWLFREHNLPVIRVYHTDPKWGPAPDSPGFQFLSSIMVKDEDAKVVKNYPSAFKKTDLEKILREKGCNTLFLCGLSATGCVLATYRGADDLDYKVFMIKDALISPKAEHTDMIEDICETVSFTTLQVILDSIQK